EETRPVRPSGMPTLPTYAARTRTQLGPHPPPRRLLMKRTQWPGPLAILLASLSVWGCVSPRCGDGIVESGEVCDDGNDAEGDNCDTACRPPSCGNKIIDPGEDCDDGNQTDGDGCTTACAREFCGDNIVQGLLGEVCDDGNTLDGDGCDS